MRHLLLFLTFCVGCYAAAPPVLFFSDLVSGPNTGGENNNGVYVTVYGNNLGSSQGTSTITVGGGVPIVKTWGTSYLWYQKIVIQLGSAAATGNIVVTTANGTSNGLPFTVRAGNIYFVATTGLDTNSGSISSPWQTMAHALSTMAAGDTTYVRAGSYLTVDDGSGWSTCMLMNGEAGTAGSPKAFIAYPGETVNLGSSTNCNNTIRSQGNGENYWVFAGFSEIIGQNVTFGTYQVHDWRIVGNGNMTCPPGNDQAGCLDLGGGLDGSEYNYWVYGNDINHSGTANAPGGVTALYHGVYLSQQMHDVDFGWNIVSNAAGGRCIQQNVNNNSTTDRSSSYSLYIHDNMIHDCQLDGIVMTTVNPHAGPVELYNNVIWNAGTGPANTENSGTWTCMDIQGWENNTSGGESGQVLVYNNTMYACGTWTSPPYNQSSAGLLWEDGNTTTKGVIATNNIIYLTVGPASGYPYMLTTTTGLGISGANNIFYNNGAAPSGTGFSLTGSTVANPLFNNAATFDFTLQSGSPAVNGGSTLTAVTEDILGIARPQNTTYSRGAYELLSGSPPSSNSINVSGSVQISPGVIFQ